MKRWSSPRLTAMPQRGVGFAALNQGESPAVYEEVRIGSGDLIVVAHVWEAMAARVRIARAGVYGVAVRFLALTWMEPFECQIVVNGRSLGEGTLSAPDSKVEWAGYLGMHADDLLDFVVNAAPRPEGEPCRVVLDFAIVEYEAASRGVVRRVDDGCSGMSDEDAAQILQAQPRVVRPVEALDVGAAERERVLAETWTLDPGYIRSQFARSATEINRDVLRAADPPALKYALLMVPRSGSTLLAELLASTGSLGYPLEYFVPDIVRSLSMAFLDRFTSYADLMLRGMQTPNGIFGIEIEGTRLLEERDFFAEPASWRFIHLRREDVLAQAISLATAVRSGVWHRFESSQVSRLVLLTREVIISEVNFLLENERIFAQFFEEASVEPLKVSYEDLVEEPATQVARIAAYVGLADVDLSRIQAHEVSVRPTWGATNRFYRTMAMVTGGGYYGYDIIEQERGAVAMLAGVDRAKADLLQDRPPLLFIEADVPRLKERVERYVLAGLQESLRADAPAG